MQEVVPSKGHGVAGDPALHETIQVLLDRLHKYALFLCADASRGNNSYEWHIRICNCRGKDLYFFHSLVEDKSHSRSEVVPLWPLPFTFVGAKILVWRPRLDNANNVCARTVYCMTDTCVCPQIRAEIHGRTTRIGCKPIARIYIDNRASRNSTQFFEGQILLCCAQFKLCHSCL